MNIRFLFIIGILFNLYACGNSQDTESQSAEKVITNPGILEGHSYSNLDKIRTLKLHLDLDVNFDNRTIYGVARHEMINNGTDTAVFDTKGLEIQKVTIGEEGAEQNADFIIGLEDSVLGAPLSVKINKNTNFINIYYKTTDQSEALGWLPGEGTGSKKQPFLYTQGEAILTRTWIPCQDVPSNRITYTADVKVPKGLMALMSAVNPVKKSENGLYHFVMDQPVPTYLIALSVGNLEYRKLGKSCGVYAEPGMINAAAWELKDLRKMMLAAEKLYGKYQWGQYDVIILPYSFPFGGMENPRLTFANPTLIAGDRSLTSVIAHELAHSWSGNLVTNANWEDFWLNEGFTVYFEHRIMEELYGKEVADILSIIEFQELKAEMEEFMNGKYPEDTRLKLNLDGRNPDDGMTTIPYVKGAYFLKTLEAKVGRDKMDAFLKLYFSTYQFSTIDTEEFIKFLNKQLLEPNKISFNTEEWIYKEGLPKNCIRIRSERLEEVQKLADDFAAGKDIYKIKPKGKRNYISLKRDQYITQEWMTFIRHVPKTVDVELLRTFDAHLHFKSWGNSEVATEWYLLAINAGYEDVKPDLEKFLIKVGRRKYLLPLYKELSKTPENKKWARQVYEKAKENYHAVSRNTVEELLK